MLQNTMTTPPNATKYAHVLRPLLVEEKEALKAGLIKDGLLSDLVVDQHNDLLDGHSRLELCQELGIMARFRAVTTDDPVKWIKEMQKARRNLDRAEMRALIAEQIIETPHLTDVAIAKIVGVSDKTVGVVRSKLIEEGKVGNVVQIRSDGKIVGNSRRSEFPSVDQPEPSTTPNSAAAPKAKPVPTKKAVLPVTVSDKGNFNGIYENIMYHFADDNQFHSLGSICTKLDPDKSLKLAMINVKNSVDKMRNRKDVRVETRPAAKKTFRYRFYRQDKLIGLTVLRAKFSPVIKDLREMADFPISFQTTRRFMDAVGLLEQILRDLEAE